MSQVITAVHAGGAASGNSYPKNPSPSQVSATKPTEHYTAPTAPLPSGLSSSDVAYIKSLMGSLPAQKMEEILLKTGVPIPVNLGPTLDTNG